MDDGGIALGQPLLDGLWGNVSTAAAEKEKTYTLEKIDGSDFNMVTLSEQAAQRLVLETSKVSQEAATGGQRLVVPYSALIYGLHGENWVYITPKPLSFHRAEVKVDYIEGDKFGKHAERQKLGLTPQGQEMLVRD